MAAVNRSARCAEVRKSLSSSHFLFSAQLFLSLCVCTAKCNTMNSFKEKLSQMSHSFFNSRLFAHFQVCPFGTCRLHSGQRDTTVSNSFFFSLFHQVGTIVCSNCVIRLFITLKYIVLRSLCYINLCFTFFVVLYFISKLPKRK